MSAIDEWDAKLDLPTSSPPRPEPPKPPPPPTPEDPLMGFIASDVDIDFQSEGEALGPGLGLDPAPAEEFTPTPTVPASQNQLLEQLLKGEAKPTPPPVTGPVPPRSPRRGPPPAPAAHDDDEPSGFEEAPATRSLPYEELQRLAQSAGADFSDLDGGRTTAVSSPDEDLLSEARPTHARGRPLPPPAEDYEVEIERPSTNKPLTKTASVKPATSIKPASNPPATARVARPIAPGQVAKPIAPPRAPRTSPPPLQPPVARAHPPASSLADIDVDVDLDEQTTGVVPPFREPAAPEVSPIEEEVTNVRDLSAVVREVSAPVPAHSGPVQLAPRAADRINLGEEPERVRPTFDPPALAIDELALPDQGDPIAADDREAIARQLSDERAAGAPAAQLLLDEGRLHERLGRPKDADACYAQAAEAGSAAALRTLARRALSRGGSEQALAALARAEEHCTSHERAALELARAALLRGRKDVEGARAALERATRDGTASRLVVALERMEIALSANEDADAAAQLGRLDSQDTDTRAALRITQGRLHERLGDDKNARIAYQAAWDAGDLAAGVGATRVALREGDPQVAAAAHATEAKGAPSCATALARRAAVFYRKAEDDPHALALLSDRAEPLALEALVEVALALGRADDAVAALEKLAQVDSDRGRQAFALLRAGELRESMGDADGAAHSYTRSAELSPSVPARRGLERTQSEHPDLERRAAALSAAAAADPARAPLLHTRVARLYAAHNQPDEARAALARALSAHASFAPALYELAALESAAGQHAAVGDALEAAAAADPDAASLLLEQAADAAARAGDGETAHRRASIAARADGAARALAWGVLGDDAAALAAEADLAEDTAFAASLHQRRGWTLAASDAHAAAEAFRAALAVAPTHPAAASALAQILGGEGRFGDWAESLRSRAGAIGNRPESAAALARAACAFEYEARDFARALTSYADADSIFPRALGARDGLFRTARLEGDADRVAQLAGLEAEAAPTIAAKAALLGLAAAALERKGEFGPAAQRYAASLDVEPSALVAHARLHALRRAGQFGPLSDAALSELKHAEDDTVAKTAAYEQLASIDERDRGDLASAAIAYESLLEIEPAHHGAMRSLERYFQSEDRREELGELYLRLGSALTDAGVAVGVWLERARLRGKTGVALDDYRAALERDRHCVPALLPLLAHARETGDHESACAYHLALSEAYAEDARAGAAAFARAADDLVTLGREAEALERYRAASDLAPDHLPAQLSRLESALRGQSYTDACAAAEALAACSHERQHQLDWNLVGAVIAEIHLGDAERARAGYDRVLTLDPAHTGAFVRLRKVLEQGEKWAELVALLENRLAHESEGYRVVELNLAMADVFGKRLGDSQRARLHLGEATRLHPTNVPALRILADLELMAESWQEASETLIKLARLERDPARLRDVFFKLGVIYADHLPDLQKAAGAFGRALSLAPTDREIVLRLSDLFVREKDWQNALTATVRLVELEKQPGPRIEWLLRQADILRDGFGDTRHAAEALRKAADVDPRDLRPVEAMAKLFAGDMASKRIHLDRAMNATRAALARDAFDLDSWAALARLNEWLEKRDAAQAAAQVLALFGAPGAKASGGFAPMWEKLTEGDARDALLPPGMPPGFRNLFSRVEETIAKVMRMDPRRHGIDKRTRQQKGSPLANVFTQMAAKIGYAPEIELHLSDSHPELCIAEPGDPPLVVLGSALVRGAGEPQLRFLAARTLYLLKSGLAIPARLSGEELGLLVGGIVWQFVPDYVHPALPQAALYESAQRMSKLLPRKAREPIMPYALECSGDLDFDKLAQGALSVGNRAGLLAAGDLGAAVDMLARMANPNAAPARGEALLKACRGNTQVAELLRFVASSEFGEIRRLLS
jgi:tetratricopeptide (TPR) repeat protein